MVDERCIYVRIVKAQPSAKHSEIDNVKERKNGQQQQPKWWKTKLNTKCKMSKLRMLWNGPVANRLLNLY